MSHATVSSAVLTVASICLLAAPATPSKPREPAALNDARSTVGSSAVAEAFASASKSNQPAASASFDALSTRAIDTMKRRAEELKIGGVAVVAYAEGETIQSWNSKMAVVGRMKDLPSAGNTGSNLLGIAYAKAAEMADTLQNSGTANRKPMTGEFGWEGGVIARVKKGYVIVAFSGGKSEDDVQVSRAGLEVLKAGLAQ